MVGLKRVVPKNGGRVGLLLRVGKRCAGRDCFSGVAEFCVNLERVKWLTAALLNQFLPYYFLLAIGMFPCSFRPSSSIGMLIYGCIFIGFAWSPWLFLLLPVILTMGAFHGAIINWFVYKFGYINFRMKNTSHNSRHRSLRQGDQPPNVI